MATDTTWPWMKEVAVPLATTPAPPAHDTDDRPSVVDLIVEYRAVIDQVATELASDPLYSAQKHDDLWILRFLLSHKKNLKASVKAAKHTLAFRAQHKLDEKDIRYFPVGPDVPEPAFQRYLKYCSNDAFQFCVPDVKLGVVGICLGPSVDMHGLVENVDEADWLPTIVYMAEWSHQWNDFLTRTSGRLTRSVRIIDLGGASFKHMNAECKKRNGDAMKVTEDCYPQLVRSVFICRAPGWVQGIWRVLRVFFPKRLVEKIDFVAPESNARDLNLLLKYISMENLPSRYGGKNQVWPVDFPLPSKIS
jgi:CRAL/TRIO domain